MMMEFRHKENTLNIFFLKKKKTKTKGERYWKGKKHFKSVNNFLTILMSNLKEKSTKIMLVVENQSIKPIPIQIKWKMICPIILNMIMHWPHQYNTYVILFSKRQVPKIAQISIYIHAWTWNLTRIN